LADFQDKIAFSKRLDHALDLYFRSGCHKMENTLHQRRHAKDSAAIRG